MAYTGILRLLASTPWAIREAELQGLIQFALLDVREAEASVAAARRTSAGGSQVMGGVAVIPLHGMLTPKPGLFSMLMGSTSMQNFTSALSEAVASPDVSSVLIDVDSPGGLVTGVPEAAAAIRAARGRKPIVSMVNADAGSAAYWLAAQAGEVVVTPSGQVGSIGVYAAHEDISKALDAAGVKVTLVSAGKHKTEGNPYEPLSAEAQDHMQSMVNEYNDVFLSDLAKGRGVSVKQVDETYGQGRMFTASRALAAGMVDRVDTFDATVRRMASGQVSRGRLSAMVDGVLVHATEDWFTSPAPFAGTIPDVPEEETPDAAPAASVEEKETKTFTAEERLRLFEMLAVPAGEEK